MRYKIRQTVTDQKGKQKPRTWVIEADRSGVTSVHPAQFPKGKQPPPELPCSKAARVEDFRERLNATREAARVAKRDRQENPDGHKEDGHSTTPDD